MLNGRNHSAAGKSIAVNGRANHTLADDTSALYGEYEQKLASELSELLKSGGTLQGASHRSLPQSPGELQAPDLPRIASRQTALQQAAPGLERAFVQAPRPKNDFAGATQDELPLPFSWKHEPRPAQPNWLARQLKSAIFGLGVGLIIVLPAVAVLSGRFDAWLPVQKQTGGERAAQPKLPATAERAATPAQAQAPAQVSQPQASQPIVAATVKTIEVRPEPAPMPAPAPVSEARAVASEAAQPPLAATARVSPEPSSTPASAAAPSPADEAANLLAVGLKLRGAGDIAGARIPLTKAANIGNAEAMYALGETFDPNMLAAWGALDVKSDASTARLFYGRAAAAGLSKAKMRLDALN